MEGKKRGCPCYILPWAGRMIRLFLANHSRRAGCMNTSAAGVLNREILSEDGNLPFFVRTDRQEYWRLLYLLRIQVIFTDNTVWKRKCVWSITPLLIMIPGKYSKSRLGSIGQWLN